MAISHTRNENRISVWGYFGYGRPLAGFIIAINLCIGMAVAGIPFLAALFGLISLGFVYGVYKSCQASGRERLNTSRNGNSRGDTPASHGNDNPVFLELTATALARNHGRVPGGNSLASFPSRPNNQTVEDQPPDYFEITGLPKPPLEDHEDFWKPKENGQTSSGSPVAVICPPFRCNRANTSSFSLPSEDRDFPVIAVIDDELHSSLYFQQEEGCRPSLDRLPSYEEALAVDYQNNSVQYDDTPL